MNWAWEERLVQGRRMGDFGSVAFPGLSLLPFLSQVLGESMSPGASQQVCLNRPGLRGLLSWRGRAMTVCRTAARQKSGATRHNSA